MYNQKKILFVGGAPKCGTSALFDLLLQTERFETAYKKETFYFIDDDYPLMNKEKNYGKNGINEFYNLFQEKENLVGLEGTTHLLYQKEMPEILKDIDCKIIFILRDPAERIQSSFEYTKNNLSNFKEPITFQTYVNLLLADKKMEIENKMKYTSSRWVLANELYLSNYNYFLDNWYKFFSTGDILLIDYTKFKNNPIDQLNKISHFTNLDFNLESVNNNQRNKTSTIRNKNVHYFFRSINKIVPDNTLKQSFKKAYFKLQRISKKDNPDDKIALDRLKQYFEEKEISVINTLKTYKNW